MVVCIYLCKGIANCDATTVAAFQLVRCEKDLSFDAFNHRINLKSRPHTSARIPSMKLTYVNFVANLRTSNNSQILALLAFSVKTKMILSIV